MTIFGITKTAKKLADERGRICECCGSHPGTQAHHCLYRRDRNVTNGSLEEKYNLQLVCFECHHVTGKADSFQNRKNFWEKQCNRYTRQTMLEWHSRVPYKIKEHIYK